MNLKLHTKLPRLPAKMEAYVDTLYLPAHQKKDNNNLKTKNNQNRQKIELHGSQTTKELKMTHSSRSVGGVKRTHGKAVAGGPGQARLQLVDQQQTAQPRVPARGK